MLDLKAKLASAGLISKEDIARAEARTEKRSTAKKTSSGPGKPASTGSGLPVAKLKGKPKSEIYEAVRRWIDQIRLDVAHGTPSERAQPFHFPQMTGRVGRLTIEPELIERLRQGEAGLVAYMSNHGMAHAVVPAEAAQNVAELFPLWLRVLEGDPRAGAIEPKAK